MIGQAGLFRDLVIANASGNAILKEVIHDIDGSVYALLGIEMKVFCFLCLGRAFINATKHSSRPLPLALPAMVVLKAMVIVKLFCSIGKCSAADEELSFALPCFGELVHRWVGARQK